MKIYLEFTCSREPCPTNFKTLHLNKITLTYRKKIINYLKCESKIKSCMEYKYSNQSKSRPLNPKLHSQVADIQAFMLQQQQLIVVWFAVSQWRHLPMTSQPPDFLATARTTRWTVLPSRLVYPCPIGVAIKGFSQDE